MSELKSIILPSVCILISLLFLIAMSAVVVINDESFRKQIINDLPSKTDFDYYLAKLEKVVDFCIRHAIYVDVDMEFGLFMVDVNLKELVQQKRMRFSQSTRFHLEKLLVKNNALTNYFHKKIHRVEDDKEKAQDIKLTRLFYNKTAWSRPADEFNQDLLKQTKVYSPDMLEEMYGKWENYIIYALDVNKIVPGPKTWMWPTRECVLDNCQFHANEYLFLTDFKKGGGSQFDDKCLENMSPEPVHAPKSEGNCEIPYDCQEALNTGSDYGYGLTQRILMMIIARFSRDCIVFSRKKDKFWTDTYCMMSFNEAEYIASNRFRLPDLMFEQIALCGLLGHAQFFRNYWLKSLLEYQTEEGCFTEKLSTGEFNEYLLREGKEDTWRLSSNRNIMNGQCDGHFTSVAVAALSNAVRYIIETHY